MVIPNSMLILTEGVEVEKYICDSSHLKLRKS